MDEMPKKRSHGDGGLYFDKSKSLWRGVIQLEPRNGKRRQKVVTARTQRACKEKLDKAKDDIRDNGGEPLDTSVKLIVWAQRWLTDYALPDVDPKTFSTYKSLTNKWIVPAIGHKKVSTLKASDVLAVRKAQKEAELSTSTQKQTYIVLSRMLEQARREKLCRSNVANDVDPPGGKGKKKVVNERGAISGDDSLKLLDVARRHKNGSLWWFKILAGQRQGEILGATLADLDLENGFYTVNWKLEELVSVHGCGDQEDGVWPCRKVRGGSCTNRVFRVPDDFELIQIKGRLHLTRPKSKTGKRVPLTPELVEIIKRDLHMNRDIPNPHGLIWRHDDGSPILPSEDASAWRTLLHKAGLIGADQLAPKGTELTGHWARHSTVTALMALGTDVQLVGEIVGQSSERVTAGYRHADDAEKMRAMKQLGAAMLKDLPKIEVLEVLPALGS